MKRNNLRVTSSAPKDPVTREASALALCLNILEDCKNKEDYSRRVVHTPDGEIITMNSAVEVFDHVMCNRSQS